MQMAQSREAQLPPPVTIEPSPQAGSSSSSSTSSVPDTVSRRDALRSRDREAGR
jgi:hypothetical protein